MNKNIKELYINILKHKIKYVVIPSSGWSMFLGYIQKQKIWQYDEPRIIKIDSIKLKKLLGYK